MAKQKKFSLYIKTYTKLSEKFQFVQSVVSHSRLARGHEVEGTLPGQVYRLTDTVFLLSRLTQSEGRKKQTAA